MTKQSDNWVEQELAGADFGDLRLCKRAKLLLSLLFSSPQQSIKSACRGLSETLGAYRFLSNPNVDCDIILESHLAQIALRASHSKTLLYIQDTTELDYTSKKHLKGSGPLSNDYRRGFFLDAACLLDENSVSLGVCRSNMFVREDEQLGKKSYQSSQHPIEAKESFRWLEGYRHCSQLAQSFPEQSMVYLADAEADIYEIFEQWHLFKTQEQVHADWIIRKHHNRCCKLSEHCEGHHDFDQYIESILCKSNELGTIDIEVKTKITTQKRAGSGVKRLRKGRKVKLSIRSNQVCLRPPYRKGKRLPALDIWVVEAKEINPPQGDVPVHWVVLTSLPAQTLKQAINVLELYTKRWEIEVFFRVLKTGCKVEELQLKNSQSVRNAVVCYLIVAWRIIYLTKLGRSCPEIPCDAVFEPEEWQSIWVIEYGIESLKQFDKSVPTLAELVVLIARYGGYLDRKTDGPPGPQAMWIGLHRVMDFSIAWKRFGPQSSMAVE